MDWFEFQGSPIEKQKKENHILKESLPLYNNLFFILIFFLYYLINQYIYICIIF